MHYTKCLSKKSCCVVCYIRMLAGSWLGSWLFSFPSELASVESGLAKNVSAQQSNA